jgi:geranylgeranyl diphosphate synthase type II
MIAIGGKRLRPRLCLTTYGLYKDAFGPQVLEPAAGLEVFHSFTLIHDDIMDRSPMRRGQDTVWKKWNPDTAILSGDVMCIDAYKRMAKAPADVLPAVLELFSKTAAEVCDGQQLDMDFESVDRVPMSAYMQMIGLKTAVLLACSAQMGALIAGAPEAECRAIYAFGYDLGLAFQVADDYLDAYGDAAVFGKPIGGDIVNNKKSWLTVKAQEQGAVGLEKALALPAKTPEQKARKIAAVKAIYESLDIPALARQEIAALHRSAVDKLQDFDAQKRDVLANFAHKLVGRTV